MNISQLETWISQSSGKQSDK